MVKHSTLCAYLPDILNLTEMFCYRYIATIDGSVNKRHLITISEGTVVEGVQCAPDIVELLPPQPDLSRPRIRIVVLIFLFLEYWTYLQLLRN